VLGDSIDHIFPIRIVETETVGALKVAIKEQKKHTFERVDADTLNLYKAPHNDLDRFLRDLAMKLGPCSLDFQPTARLTFEIFLL
jgi:hypothetical protein